MSQNDSKVIGFFAYASRDKVLCTDGAGLKESMGKYLKEIEPTNINKLKFTDSAIGSKVGHNTRIHLTKTR